MRTSSLIALTLAVVALAVPVEYSALASDAHSDTTPRLTSKQVSSLAAAALGRSGEVVSRFKAREPSYDPEKKAWSVFFIQSAPPLIVDGDKLVVIDDRTSKACVQFVMAVGPCT